MQDQWYILHKGRALGPHSIDSLRSAAASGTLSDSAQVRCGEDGEWIYAAEVDGLFPRGLSSDAALRKGYRVCTQCGTAAKPARRTPGSFIIELVLWLTFLLPGLIYSIWRITTRGNVCSSCGSRQLVAPDSPVGKRLLSQ